MIRLRRAFSRSLASERGYSLMEVLMASTLLIVVLGATLGTLDHFQGATRRTQDLGDAQERARMASDRLARDLRNLAGPTSSQEDAIEAHEPDDLVFRAVDEVRPGGSSNRPNVRRVRYCLDHGTGRLLLQSQTWTTPNPGPMPSTADCPAGVWGGHEVLVDGVSNGDRPAWLYNGATASDITEIRTDLFVEGAGADDAEETRLSTGVLLRNQNRAPVAFFTADVVANGLIRLNASSSRDPEGGVLRFRWYVDGEPPTVSDVTFDFVAGSAAELDIKLVVTDRGGLSAEYRQSVTPQLGDVGA